MIDRALFVTLVRYFSVSMAVYMLIVGGMFVLVDWLHVDKVASYVLVYIIAYIAEYTMTLLLVFRSDHHWLKVLKFLAHTAIFLVLGTQLFKAMLSIGINYLLATFAVAIILMPLRFLSNKYLVYR